MIKFKEKQFAFPVAAAIGAAGLGLTGAQMIQEHGHAKEAEEAAEKQEEMLRKQNELIKRQNKELEKIKERNPKAGAAAERAVKSFSTAGSFIKAAKEVGKAAQGAFGKDAMRNIKMGAGIGIGGYAAGKYIQHDMKKEGLEVGEDGNLAMKSYAEPATAGLLGKAKSVGGKALGAVGNMAFGAIPALEYTADKSMVKAQMKATKSFSVLSGLAKTVKGWGGIAENVAMKGNWKTWGSGLAANASSFGLAGPKNLAKFSESLAKSSNSTVAGVGKWMQANPNATKVAAVVPGAAAMSLTMNGSEKAVKKATEAVDPKAYAYQNAKAQQTQYSAIDQTDNIKRMKDSDIIAENYKSTSTGGATLRGAGIRAGVGTAVGAVAGAIRGKSLKSIKNGAMTGAALGGVVGGGVGHHNAQPQAKENKFYNDRLAFAKEQALKREAKDWKYNMKQRDGYSF